jgi:tetratricopeptide (TPR) repeat protein
MKKVFIIIVLQLMCINATKLLAQSFETANDYYSKGKYDEAIVAYEKILSTGKESAELYYNLGNAYFKNKKIALSILNYERAYQMAPGDEDIKFNLELARTFVVDKINTLPEFFLKVWFRSLMNLFSSDSWAIVSAVLFVVSLVLFFTYLLFRRSGLKKIFFISALGFLLFSIVTFAFAWSGYTRASSKNYGIIMHSPVQVKSSPDQDGTDIFVLHEGVKVVILDKVNNWLNIRIADGNKGWVDAADLEKI